MAHGPIQAGDRHVDDDQRGSEERHFAPQQPETRVDISGKGVEELVDDGHVIHGVSSGSAGTAGAMPSAGSSKLGGIGGRSPSVWYSSGPAWPEKKRRRKASAAARQASSPVACRSAAHCARTPSAARDRRPGHRQGGRPAARRKRRAARHTGRGRIAWRPPVSCRRSSRTAACTACRRPGSAAAPRGRAPWLPPAAPAPATPPGLA